MSKSAKLQAFLADARPHIADDDATILNKSVKYMGTKKDGSEYKWATFKGVQPNWAAAKPVLDELKTKGHVVFQKGTTLGVKIA